MGLRTRLRDLGQRVRQGRREPEALASRPVSEPTHADGQEPPVVARLLVEIRSDGTQTVARGALDDRATGQQVAVEAHGRTPTELAASLARSLLALPFQGAVAAALAARRARDRDEEGADG